MNKKCFAALMSALDLTRQIQKLTDDVLNKPNGCTQAYNKIKKIAELNDKYIRDFGAVDPYWKPADAPLQGTAYVAKQNSTDEFTDEQYNARFAATFNQYSAQKPASNAASSAPAASDKQNLNAGRFSDSPFSDMDEDGDEIYE